MDPLIQEIDIHNGLYKNMPISYISLNNIDISIFDEDKNNNIEINNNIVDIELYNKVKLYDELKNRETYKIGYMKINPYNFIGKSIFYNESAIVMMNILYMFETNWNLPTNIKWITINNAPGGESEALNYYWKNSIGYMTSCSPKNNVGYKWNLKTSNMYNYYIEKNNVIIYEHINNFSKYMMNKNLNINMIYIDNINFNDNRNYMFLTNILFILNVLSNNGNVIIKVDDTYTNIFKELLLLLSLNFEKLYIVKPLSSHPLKNEKYLILINKHECVKNMDIIMNIYSNFNKYKNKIIDYNDIDIMEFDSYLNRYNNFLLNELVFFNEKLIDYFNNKHISYILYNNSCLYDKWNIPINMMALHDKYIHLPIKVNIIDLRVMNNLNDDYIKWLNYDAIWNLLIKIMNQINNNNNDNDKDSKFTYTITNIFVRFFLWLSNYPEQYNIMRDLVLDELKFHNINITSRNFDLIMSEKGEYTNNNKKIIDIISGYIEYGDFNATYNPKIIYELLKLNNNHDDLIRTALRYNSIKFNTSNFWSIPPSVYKYLHDVLNVEYEAYANPFSHNLEKYYSPFPDLDCKYNSLGSFLESKLKPGKYAVNPPYTERFIYATNNKILECLNSDNKYTFYVYYPDWKNNKNIEDLKNSKYMKNYKSITNNYLYDLVSDQYIQANFTTIFIWLTNDNVDSNNDNFDKLIENFYRTYNID